MQQGRYQVKWNEEGIVLLWIDSVFCRCRCCCCCCYSCSCFCWCCQIILKSNPNFWGVKINFFFIISFHSHILIIVVILVFTIFAYKCRSQTQKNLNRCVSSLFLSLRGEYFWLFLPEHRIKWCISIKRARERR